MRNRRSTCRERSVASSSPPRTLLVDLSVDELDAERSRLEAAVSAARRTRSVTAAVLVVASVLLGVAVTLLAVSGGVLGVLARVALLLVAPMVLVGIAGAVVSFRRPGRAERAIQHRLAIVAGDPGSARDRRAGRRGSRSFLISREIAFSR